MPRMWDSDFTSRTNHGMTARVQAWLASIGKSPREHSLAQCVANVEQHHWQETDGGTSRSLRGAANFEPVPGLRPGRTASGTSPDSRCPLWIEGVQYLEYLCDGPQ